MLRRAAISSLLVFWWVSCGPVPMPMPPQHPPFDEVARKTDCARIWQMELWRQIDPSGLAGCLADFRRGATEAQITANVRLSEEYRQLHAPKPTTPIIHADGKIFRTATGEAWRWKGVSQFKLMARFAAGEDIGPVFRAYRGFNILRVWPYVTWNGAGWEPPSVDVARRFLNRCADEGFLVEFTLLTDDVPFRIQWAKEFVGQLASGQKPTNLVIEIGNEPDTHKAIDTKALKATLDASGFQYASGNYENSQKSFGTFLTHHSQRDSEWPRRAHDCLDFYNGGGPHKPTDPAHKVPCVLDEPAKLQDVSGDRINDWRAYFGVASLLAGGGTFHSETGKFGLPPTAEEAAIAAAALEGLSAFPADAALGAYSRPVEHSLRTYVVGPYMVRVRPTTDSYGSGWAQIGQSTILWRKY